MEQSEACRQSRKTKRRLSSHSAKHSLAYIASVTTRRVSKADAELATDSDSLTYVGESLSSRIAPKTYLARIRIDALDE
ncbi:protein containing DUF1589 [Rhodopirellula europaea SH398]|uniref:Protein containing DUF1589 n=1 Tax=Rhodopirellula europaea SH398 TaxID=1263868 RepID=M5S0D1_9BACT|nr:DUF1589 domain-containing protein [Rhodopirellula europaea]EMI25010.1 protein containing DUF1589 [Rhodopirellula europaea SH398]